ncbi:hypothetical protein PoB_004765100 [Plakobranchus ocellatus]|uniref:Uncharacterized protein n=1 Tax=Plakobranchus ocellatus TaxID=259542 RepID=A0AAV4BCS1_9GAST|nr:hypothetical protein PoB_004765100 [Plakobranchus ocellatus]
MTLNDLGVKRRRRWRGRLYNKHSTCCHTHSGSLHAGCQDLGYQPQSITKEATATVQTDDRSIHTSRWMAGVSPPIRMRESDITSQTESTTNRALAFIVKGKRASKEEEKPLDQTNQASIHVCMKVE